MLGITTAASVGAALSQLEFGVGCAVLVLIVVVSPFVVPKTAWRYCVYCGIGGVVIGMLLMLLFMYLTLGRISGSTYAQTGPLIDIINTWRPWIVFCGSLVGGTTGLLLFQIRSARMKSPTHD